MMKSNNKIPVRRTCTLMITYKCNLNCVYCYEKYKCDKKMTFETAKHIIEKEFEFVEHSQEYDELEIDFMGGEPFMEFNLIRNIVEWIASTKRPVPWICFATTNGTLLTPEIKCWMCRNRDKFVAGLSFDGTPEMQDLNRTQSASKIDIDFFMKLYPFQGVKMTVSCDSVKKFADGIIFLHKKKIPVSANCGYGMPWTTETYNIYREELLRLAKFYLAHPKIKPISIFESKFAYVGKMQNHQKFCGTGTAMITYDVDGTIYPCHLFTPIVLGNTEAANLQKKYNFCSETTYFDKRCEGCCLEHICPTCYGFNYKTTGDISRRDPTMCELVKVQTEVSAWYHLELLKIKSKRKKKISKNDLQTASGIVYYFEHPPKSLIDRTN